MARSVRESGAAGHGYSIIELLFVVGLMGVIAAIAVPMMGNTLGFYRLDTDARSLKNAASLTKMQAAANFAESRLYVDTSVNGFHTEIKASGGTWTTLGGITYLSSSGESYSFGSVSNPPPNAQATIFQAPKCKNNATPPVDIGNTMCIDFNSRGIPIDTTGAPTGTYALYLTDGTAIYGLTVSATGSISLWRTKPTSTATWVQQ